MGCFKKAASHVGGGGGSGIGFDMLESSSDAKTGVERCCIREEKR